MNQSGNEYIQKQNTAIKEWNRKIVASTNLTEEQKKRMRWENPSWADSVVQERIVRLGTEARTYQIDMNEPNELEEMAIATLKEDFLKKRQ